jgi:hypothetical protein
MCPDSGLGVISGGNCIEIDGLSLPGELRLVRIVRDIEDAFVNLHWLWQFLFCCS